MRRRFTPDVPVVSGVSIKDTVILLGIIGFLYLGLHLAMKAPSIIQGPQISLDARLLPYYSFRSLARMTIAYFLSVIFSLVYGYMAAKNKTARTFMLPILDILQSIPILSFLPVVLLSLTAILKERIAVEIAAIILIFTSQAWNMIFSFYQSLTTIPSDLKEAAEIYRFNWWLRFKALELPFAALGLIWNSIMSWAGGWFFLMAAEIFTVGQRDFRLPGLGSYLQLAANEGDIMDIMQGVAALILMIVVLDQLIWRPLLAWADKFKVESTEGEEMPESWFYDLLSRSLLIRRFIARPAAYLLEQIDSLLISLFQKKTVNKRLNQQRQFGVWMWRFLGLVAVGVFLYGVVKAVFMVFQLSPSSWGQLALAAGASWLRVILSLIIALLWTVPLGVAIGLKPRLASILQPILQIVASIPATALFPIILIFLIGLPGGLNLAAILLMLLGTQWYLLFNIIAGAMAIPRDLINTTTSLGLKGWDRWKTLNLPALYPYLITGLIIAHGGAWNATVVAEFVSFGGSDIHTVGLGALISQSTKSGNYSLLLVSTLAMIFIVISTNRFIWRRLYKLAEERFHLD
ncbi:MAG: ABC transporter permease subunit [Candidatus Tectomicrobia bacterium]|uniref:ABC transporter permease subunit n=1 Tax=Tectimicrobiota bacterium TaxID=2528274 RepID=A0A933LQP8_UNCTE|nr:ABC transporter permease subunit [Candidatus Tectomicrobia bacterium]